MIQNLLISLVSFVVVLSVVVFVHEFGHFQVARWRKVAIDTFSIGFGKTVFGWRDRQGVLWKVGALPLGGYVKFADDTDAVSSAPKEQIDDPEAKAEARRKGLFHAQPLLTRTLVVAAGPTANFIFAIFAFAIIAMSIGRDVTNYETVTARIGAVIQNSAAAQAGLRAGDVVTAIDERPVENWGAFQRAIQQSEGRTLNLTLNNEGATRNTAVTPRFESRLDVDGSTNQRYTLGVLIGPLPEERVIVPVNPIEAVGMGAQETWALVNQTVTYITEAITRKNSGREIAGPIGIFQASGQVAGAAFAGPDRDFWDTMGDLVLNLLRFAAMISVAVGFVNLLPIPILDGGHLMFYVIEALRGGKPLPPVAQEWAYRAGFAVMASLFLFASWNDITRALPGAPG